MASTASRPRRGVLIVLAAVVTMLVLGAVVGRFGASSEADSMARDETVANPTEPGRTEGDPGGPRGFAQNRNGAEAAAIAYATAPQQWLYLSDDEIERAVHRMASQAVANDLAQSVVADVAEARAELGESPGRVWWLVRPLASRVESADRAEARVSVWVVTVLSAEGVAAPQAEWITVTVDLVWRGSDWKVDAVRDVPGPTPMIGPGDRPWDAEPFDHFLEDFVRMDGQEVVS